jgi:hypothetical protein
MRVVKLFVLAGAVWVGLSSSSCAPEGACNANGDCASGQSCVIDDDGAGRCVSASEGEGEGEVTVSLSASVEGINAGQTVTLTWTVTGTSACELRAGDVLVPDVVVAEEAVEVTPLRTTTYAIVCAGVRDDVTVRVSSLDVEEDVLVQQAVTMRLPLVSGELDLTACTLTGAEAAEAAIDAPGSALVLTLTEPRALTIICDGLGGPVVAEVSVDIFHLNAPDIINAGDELPLTVNHTSLQGCTVRVDGVVTVPTYIGVPGGGGDVSYVMGTPLEDATYDVSCPGAAGELTASALVRVRPRIVTFDAAVSRDPDVDGLTLTVETLGGGAGDCVLDRGDGVVAPATNGTTAAPVLAAGPHAHSLTCRADETDAAPVTQTLTSWWGDLDTNATEGLAALEGIQFLVGALQVAVDASTDLSEALNLDSLVEMNRLRINISAQPGTWALSAPALRFATFFYARDWSGTLTTFDCPALLDGRDLGPEGTALTSISLPVLSELGILESTFTGGVALDLPSLVHAEDILIGNALSVSVPLLESIEYFEVRDSPSLTAFALPGIVSIDYLRFMGVPALASLSFPDLTTIDNQLWITDASALETLDLAAVASVGGPVRVTELDALTSLDLGALTSAASLTIGGEALTSVDLDLLENVGDFSITGAGLTSLALPVLQTATSVQIAGTPNLVTLSLPALNSAESLTLVTLVSLTSSDLSQLGSLQSLSLNVCLTPPVFSALTSVAGDVTIDGFGPATLAFPALESIGGSLDMTAAGVVVLSAPLLESVGALNLQGNASLTGLDFPSLDAISELVVLQNPSLLCGEIIDAYCGNTVQDPSPTVLLNLEPAPFPAPQCNSYVTPGC